MVAASLVVSPMVAAIRALYGVAKDFNNYLDTLIEEMKRSENQTIARIGRVLEGAKFGFAIGMMTSVIIIAVGQLLLGNPLAAAAAVATIPFSPISMTCAAVGAIYYGWIALSNQERDEILERLRTDLGIGVEMIKAIVAYVITKSTELLSAENMAEFKRFVRDAATAFDRTLSDVTRSAKDRAAEIVGFVARKLRLTSREKAVLPAPPQ